MFQKLIGLVCRLIPIRLPHQRVMPFGWNAPLTRTGPVELCVPELYAFKFNLHAGRI